MREEYRVFQIDKQDTVATALQDIPSGERVHIFPGEAGYIYM